MMASNRTKRLPWWEELQRLDGRTRSTQDMAAEFHETNEAQANFLQVILLVLIVFIFATVMLSRNEVAQSQLVVADVEDHKRQLTELQSQLSLAEIDRSELQQELESANESLAELNKRLESEAKNRLSKETESRSDTEHRIELMRAEQLRDEAIDTRDKALLDFQLQRMLLELEKIETRARKRLGLTTFATSSADESSITIRLVFRKSQLSEDDVSRLFRTGCRYAQELFADNQTMRQSRDQWVAEVYRSVGGKAARNRSRLSREAERRLVGLRRDTRLLHDAARDCIHRYYRQHPEQLNDTELRRLLDRFSDAIVENEADADSLAKQVSSRLREFVNSVFQDRGIELLP